jgi:hypothetical protein
MQKLGCPDWLAGKICVVPSLTIKDDSSFKDTIIAELPNGMISRLFADQKAFRQG